MINLKGKTRNDSVTQGKQKVYFCCYPEDFDPYFDSICRDIFQFQDCAIWYKEDSSETWDSEEMEEDLGLMQLFVIPVTRKFLEEENEARCVEFPFAMEHHIPILPLMQEKGLEEEFNSICGNLQCLEKSANDATAISYDVKLQRYLSQVLLDDDLQKKVREAYDAYIFLSYRKKDRKLAQDLMHLIHQNDFCRDIAIWYDEFLSPGEDFNNSIREALDGSSLVTFSVTPNLLEPGNYVMTEEYPAAKDTGKPMIMAEMDRTDQESLQEAYVGMPAPVDAHEGNGLSEELLSIIQQLNIEENDQDLEHLYLIGLGYLSGASGEVDCEKGIALLTQAAGQGNLDAQKMLGGCYATGRAVFLNNREAFKWYSQAAAQGDAEAQYDVGVCYANGQGVQQDYEKAVQYYKMAADQGYASAQYNLALCMEEGLGTAKSPRQAVKLYTKAAEQGHRDAQTALGKCYYDGVGVLFRDPKKAVQWFAKAADQGEPVAQFNLGLCYMTGAGVPVNMQEAAACFEKSAEQGFAPAQSNLGNLYEMGQGVPPDPEKAAKWLMKAAKQGLAAAQCVLGYNYEIGNGVSQDYRQAYEWYKKAAEQENSDAEDMLGLYYKNGQVVRQDDEKVAAWAQRLGDQEPGEMQDYEDNGFEEEQITEEDEQTLEPVMKLAMQGDAEAQCILGSYYYYGEDEVQPDYDKAVEWYTRAAEQNVPEAQVMLAQCYIDGTSTARDYKKAVELYAKAAEDDRFAYCLGVCYLEGDIVEQDEHKAYELILRSAKQDVPYAEYLTGYCYEDGCGVPQNYEYAIYWYGLAMQNGSRPAVEALEKLSDISLTDPEMNKMMDDEVEKEIKALNQGDVISCYILGVRAQVGIGAPPDLEMASRFYELAARAGFEAAQKAYDNMNATGMGMDYKDFLKKFQ